MIINKTKPAFTLIELLVVIAIIGILATVSVIAFQNARAKSRDAKRIGDVKQVQTALELFFNDQNRYPTADEWNSGKLYSTSTGVTSTYMQVIPNAPTPADGLCADAKNTVGYTPSEDGTSYSISFCLGNTTGTLTPGPKCLTPGGIVDVDCSNGGSAPVVLLDPCQTQTCTWQTVGTEGLSPNASYSPTISLNNGTPYVGFLDGASSKISVMNYNGSSWNDVGSPSFTMGMSFYPFLTFYNNEPYLAYGDVDYSGGVLMKYNGSSWNNVGSVPFSSGGGLAFFNNSKVYGGNLYTCFMDGSDSNIYVSKYDGSSSSFVGGAVSPGASAHANIAVNDSGVIYVAFSDSSCLVSTQQLSVKKYNGSNWEYVGDPCLSAGSINWPSISVDGNTVYVSYNDQSDSFRMHVKKYSGTSWSDVGNPISVGQSDYSNIYFYNGNLYLAYTDANFGYVVFVKKFNGSTWQNVGSSQASAGGGNQLKMTMSDGIIYIAYSDYSYGSKITVRKFAP